MRFLVINSNRICLFFFFLHFSHRWIGCDCRLIRVIAIIIEKQEKWLRISQWILYFYCVCRLPIFRETRVLFVHLFSAWFLLFFALSFLVWMRKIVNGSHLTHCAQKLSSAHERPPANNSWRAEKFFVWFPAFTIQFAKVHYIRYFFDGRFFHQLSVLTLRNTQTFTLNWLLPTHFREKKKKREAEKKYSFSENLQVLFMLAINIFNLYFFACCFIVLEYHCLCCSPSTFFSLSRVCFIQSAKCKISPVTSVLRTG